MPSRPLSNSELLARRLRQQLFCPSPPEHSHKYNLINDIEADEVVKILVSALAQLPPSSARSLRARFSDLFCPFCGSLHPLSSCTHPGVTEYRLDPVAWMQEHIPAGLHQHMAHVEVKSKKSRIAQKQSKTLSPEEVKAGFEKLKKDVANVRGDDAT